jgi:hypothetical protein
MKKYFLIFFISIEITHISFVCARPTKQQRQEYKELQQKNLGVPKPDEDQVIITQEQALLNGELIQREFELRKTTVRPESIA